jgi:hypothetical protein
MSSKETARTVAAGLREEDFAFTVKAVGAEWDVYRFTLRGKRGTIAFKMEDEQVTISVFQAGELTRAQSVAAIEASYATEEKPARTVKGERTHWVKGYVRNGVKIAGYFRGRK